MECHMVFVREDLMADMASALRVGDGLAVLAVFFKVEEHGGKENKFLKVMRRSCDYFVIQTCCSAVRRFAYLVLHLNRKNVLDSYISYIYKRNSNSNTFNKNKNSSSNNNNNLGSCLALLCRQNVVGHTPKLTEAGAHVKGIPSGLEVLWEKVDKEKYLYYEVYCLK